MSTEQILLKEIEESKRWFEIEKDDSTYKRDLQKRIDLINWVLENMNNPDIFICEIIESKMNEIIDPLQFSKFGISWTLTFNQVHIVKY